MNVIIKDLQLYGRVVDFIPNARPEDFKLDRDAYLVEATEDCYTKRYGRWWITECEKQEQV